MAFLGKIRFQYKLRKERWSYSSLSHWTLPTCQIFSLTVLTNKWSWDLEASAGCCCAAGYGIESQGSEGNHDQLRIGYQAKSSSWASWYLQAVNWEYQCLRRVENVTQTIASESEVLPVGLCQDPWSARPDRSSHAVPSCERSPFLGCCTVLRGPRIGEAESFWVVTWLQAPPSPTSELRSSDCSWIFEITTRWTWKFALNQEPSPSVLLFLLWSDSWLLLPYFILASSSLLLSP